MRNQLCIVNSFYCCEFKLKTQNKTSKILIRLCEIKLARLEGIGEPHSKDARILPRVRNDLFSAMSRLTPLYKEPGSCASTARSNPALLWNLPKLGEFLRPLNPLGQVLFSLPRCRDRWSVV